jgi:hypothetical protein
MHHAALGQFTAQDASWQRPGLPRVPSIWFGCLYAFYIPSGWPLMSVAQPSTRPQLPSIKRLLCLDGDRHIRGPRGIAIELPHRLILSPNHAAACGTRPRR